jgi:hypothetical protein
MSHCRCLAIALLILTAAHAQGAKLRIEFDRGAEKGPLTVRIAHHPAVKTAKPAESTVVFDDLPAGARELLIEGDAPLKVMSVMTFLDAQQTTRLRIAIPSGFVYGKFTLGGHALASREVVLDSDAESRRTRLTTGADGSYQSVVWRRGDYNVVLDGQSVGTLVIPEGLAPHVDLDIPDRHISGRVTTADGAPVSGVVLALETNGARHTMRRITTDADGGFTYSGVETGKQTLRVVTAEGLLRPGPIDFALGAADDERDVHVVLDDGVRRIVDVVDHHDVPRGDVNVLCVAGGQIRSSAKTGAKGEVAIDVPRGEGCTLYVLPREGALAIHRIASDVEAEKGRIRITLPSVSAAIDLVAKRTDGTAMPEVAFLMRYNGDIVPLAVVREIGVLYTDGDGVARLPRVPPGFYEFWPYRSDDEMAALLETAGALDPPIRLNAKVGENRVEVRFAKRH